MNIALKSFLWGCGIEALFAAFVLLGGGIGPCGFDNPLGIVGFIGHIPGLYLTRTIESLSPPDWLYMIIVALIQIVIFSSAAFAYFTYQGKKRRR